MMLLYPLHHIYFSQAFSAWPTFPFVTGFLLRPMTYGFSPLIAICHVVPEKQMLKKKKKV